MSTINQRRRERLRPEEALFLALQDPQTSHFLRTTFAIPEQRPDIVTKRWATKDRRCPSWQVAIIEKPGAVLRPSLPLLNIAHLMVDALDGKILQRWFLQNVFYEEYKAFIKKAAVRPEGCKGQSS